MYNTEIAIILRWLEAGEYKTAKVVGVTPTLANEILEQTQEKGNVTVTVTVALPH